MFDEAWTSGEVERELNETAGSLKGWHVMSNSKTSGIIPGVGYVKLGLKWKSSPLVSLMTPQFNSDKLRSDIGTKCIVTAQVSHHASNVKPAQLQRTLKISQYRGDVAISSNEYDLSTLYPDQWAENILATSDQLYTRYYRYYEVKFEAYLRNGDVVSFERTSTAEKGNIILGDIKVEVVPGEYENGITNPNDTGIGTEPDDTNYDVYGLGEFPITHWYTVEPWTYKNPDGSYNDELTKQRYQEMKDAGINIALYQGHSIDCSIAEQKRILGICEQVGLKFIGQTQYGGNIDMIPEIKANLATSNAYIGDYICDEPGSDKFDQLGAYVDEFLRQIPEKDVYINLFPEYANATSQLKNTNYEEHIDQYLEKVNTKTVSYDYYGLNINGSANSDYYHNLDLVRYKTLDARKPYWVITQAGRVGDATRTPNEVEERWTVWSTIAGGSKGISYFCYWTPSGGNYDTKPHMIDLNGNKTDMYYYVQRINADINTIGKKLLPCHADGLIVSTSRFYPLFVNNGLGRTKYGPIKSVSAVENHVTVGCFRDARISENGENYKGYKALVVAHQANKDIVTSLTLDTSVTTITATQNNTTKVIDLNNLTNVKVIDGEKGINLTYTNGKLTLDIPQGEALLIEF